MDQMLRTDNFLVWERRIMHSNRKLIRISKDSQTSLMSNSLHRPYKILLLVRCNNLCLIRIDFKTTNKLSNNLAKSLSHHLTW